MPHAQYQELLIGQADATREDIHQAGLAVGEAKTNLERAKTSYLPTLGRSREAIYEDLAGPSGIIEGERVFDFIGASLRVNGAPKARAERRAEELATVLTDASTPRPVMCRAITFVIGSVLDGAPSIPEYSIPKPRPQYHDGYRLVAATDRPNIFVRHTAGSSLAINVAPGEWSLKSSASVLSIPTSNADISVGYGREGDMIGEDVEVGAGAERFFCSIYGRSIHDRDNPPLIHNAEIVSLLGLLRISADQQPDVPYATVSDDSANRQNIREGQTIAGYTLDRISTYAANIKGLTGYPGNYNIYDQGLPVEFHPALLERHGIDEQAVHTAVAIGLVNKLIDLLPGAGSLPEASVERIATRLADGKSPRIGHEVSGSILKDARNLRKYLANIGVTHLLDVSPQKILEAVKQEPRLYRSAARPARYHYDDKHEAVQAAIDTYLDSSPPYAQIPVNA